MQFTPVLEASGDPDQIEIECGDVGHKVDKCSRQRVGFEAKQKLVSVDVCKKSCKIQGLLNNSCPFGATCKVSFNPQLDIT